MHARSFPPRWPVARQLWTLVGGVALFMAIATLASALVGPRSIDRGQDFVAFYAAGRLAAEGRGPAMYDLDTLGALERSIAAESHYAMTAPTMPWLNPPHAALLFAPLATTLGLRAALAVWTTFGVACLIAAGLMLAQIVGEASPRRRDRWLAIAAVLASPPTWVALQHGQNTPLSLLLLTVTVVAWRARRPILAGVACAMLAYKPQLAAAVGVAVVLTLGWRAIAGLAIGGVPLILATRVALPGALSAFVQRMPADVRAICFDRAFCWERHVTLQGFLRQAFHGDGPGDTPRAVVAAGTVLTSIVATALALAWWRTRDDRPGARDRFIVAVVLAMPLSMPYFVDYDLLLLVGVAGAVAAREMLAGRDDTPAARWLRGVAMATYGWMLVNALVAQAAGINVAVPLLAVMFALQVKRCARSRDASASASAFADRRTVQRQPPVRAAA